MGVLNNVEGTRGEGKEKERCLGRKHRFYAPTKSGGGGGGDGGGGGGGGVEPLLVRD